MLRLTVLPLLSAALFGLQATGKAESPVTVYTSFETIPTDTAVDEMKAELENIMAPIGLELEWRSLEGTRGNEVSSELVVVSFRGGCRMDAEPPAVTAAGALGWTHMSDGDVLPFSDIDCDRVRRLILPFLAGEDRRRKDAVLGRAIGRVVAHELYHIFANTTHHGGGIAKPFYTGAELVSEQFRFRDKETKVLRGGKLKTLVRHQSQAGPSASGQ